MRRIFLLFTFYFLLFTFIIACGRRGEPVAITPIEEKPVEKAPVTKNTVIPERHEVISPQAPTGLVGVYTGKGVILTWDEIIGHDIKGYNVYRSTGDGFELTGKTITPAFTDTNVKPDMRYLYRVTAVADVEGPPSQEIEVFTRLR